MKRPGLTGDSIALEDGGFATSNRYSPEVRERVVRMVFEHEGEYASQWQATISIVSKFGCTAETLRRWVPQAAVVRQPGDGRGQSFRCHHRC
jgi:transposase-like protein